MTSKRQKIGPEYQSFDLTEKRVLVASRFNVAVDNIAVDCIVESRVDKE